MKPEIDIPGLRRAAEAALEREWHSVSGGWSATVLRGRVYKGATFDFADKTWVVVTGPQRPASAQLLDATACLKELRRAHHGVALLRPERVPARQWHPAAGATFRARYQAAAWEGLGILAVDAEDDSTPWTWEPAARMDPGDLDDLAKDVAKAISESRRINRGEWDDVVERRASREAERLVREAVTTALQGRFEEKRGKDREFDAMWRHAIADGVWKRTGRQPETLALEVKVSEDVGAPFCQAMDDLGKFDAVIYVRLLGARTHKEMDRLSGLHALKAVVKERLPLRFIDVHFPAIADVQA